MIKHNNINELWSGDIIRVFVKNKSEFYYIDQVFDLMVFESNDEEYPLGLISITGQKSGKIFFHFPKNAFLDNGRYSVSFSWIQENIYDYLYLNKEDTVILMRNNSILEFL